MAVDKKSKFYTLHPDWKHFFLGYLFSVLLLPVLIGIFLFIYVRRKHRTTRYKISDTQITAICPDYHQNIDIENIEFTKIQRNWLQNKLGIGDLVLHTSSSQLTIAGIENPEQLKSMIEKAVAYRQSLKQQKTGRKRSNPDFKPGAMEKMDYLTGLWQQGLLSDDDFNEEKKHFE